MASGKAGPSAFLRNLIVAYCFAATVGALFAADDSSVPKGHKPKGGATSSAPSGAASKEAATRSAYGPELKLSYIAPGKFTMGYVTRGNAPGVDTRHEVTLTHGYYIGAYLVTEDQVLALMGNRWLTRCAGRHDRGVGENVPGAATQKYSPQSPVEPDWVTVEAFCKELSKKTGNKVRLPTEAEWEYACRAGTKTRFFWGDDPKDGRDYVPPQQHNIHVNHPQFYDVLRPWSGDAVGKGKPNPWGLYDMYGGWQWCSDWCSPWLSFEAVNRGPLSPHLFPLPPPSGRRRIQRGRLMTPVRQGGLGNPPDTTVIFPGSGGRECTCAPGGSS